MRDLGVLYFRPLGWCRVGYPEVLTSHLVVRLPQKTPQHTTKAAVTLTAWAIRFTPGGQSTAQPTTALG